MVMVIGGYVIGVIVESQMGCLMKLGGNLGYFWMEGVMGVYIQGEMFNFYDFDWVQLFLCGDCILFWNVFFVEFMLIFEVIEFLGGVGFVLMMFVIMFLMIKVQIDVVCQCFFEVCWVQYELVYRDVFYEGMKIVFGEFFEVQYDFIKVDVVFSFDFDFLVVGFGVLWYVCDFLVWCRFVDGVEMNCFYVVELMLMEIGFVVDYCVFGMLVEIVDFVKVFVVKFGVLGIVVGELYGELVFWVDVVVSDL